jgi:hypothetical protein
MKSTPGCVKSTDCDDLSIWLNENLPKEESFKHFSTFYADMVMKVRRRLATHKIRLLIIESPTEPYQVSKALEEIANNRAAAEVESKEHLEINERKIVREIKKEVKMADNEIYQAGKGIRSTVKFMVTDELLVPKDLLSVDKTKVNEYIDVNKEKIKTDLHQGRETVPGIKFYVDDSYIVVPGSN